MAEGPLVEFGLGYSTIKGTILPFTGAALVFLVFVQIVQSPWGHGFLGDTFKIDSAIVVAAMASFPSQDLIPLLADGADPQKIMKSQMMMYLFMGVTCAIVYGVGVTNVWDIIGMVMGSWAISVVLQWMGLM